MIHLSFHKVCQDYNSGEAKCGAASTEQIVKRGNDYYVLYSGGTDGRQDYNNHAVKT